MKVLRKLVSFALALAFAVSIAPLFSIVSIASTALPPSQPRILQVSRGLSHSLAIDENGRLWAWGHDGRGQLGRGYSCNWQEVDYADDVIWRCMNIPCRRDIIVTTPINVMPDTRFQSVSTGTFYSLAIDTSGNLWAWGDNARGQLGSGYRCNFFRSDCGEIGYLDGREKCSNASCRGRNPIPTIIQQGTQFQSIAAGNNHALAIDTDGELWGWGDNSIGRLGMIYQCFRQNLNGLVSCINEPCMAIISTPIRILPDIRFQTISADFDLSFAIDTSGHLWGWGLNYNIHLGDGTADGSPVPTVISYSTHFQNVFAGNSHTLAIDTDGRLWGWGRNFSSQLGNGYFCDVKITDGLRQCLNAPCQASSPMPERILPDMQFKGIAAGWRHSLAIDTDGRLWKWGNTGGDLSENIPTPTEISPDMRFRSVSAEFFYTLAIDADGGVWEWGIGENTPTRVIFPAVIFTPATQPIESAESWAHPGITSAISRGFVPAIIQENYTNVITRQEFCRLAVHWVEYMLGKNINDILTERNLSRFPNPFTDTTNNFILAAYALGITSGIGEGRFDPQGNFTREQAATMIMNTLRVIDPNITIPATSDFADINAAAEWARPGINFVQANGIMSGTGDNSFSPHRTFTRQESIVTFDNIDISNFTPTR